MKILLEPLKRDQRAAFLIFLAGGDLSQLSKDKALASVKARTHSEAVSLASKRGIGNGARLLAVMDLDGDSRIVIEG